LIPPSFAFLYPLWATGRNYCRGHWYGVGQKLKGGSWKGIWEEYEWRRKLPVPIGNRTFTQPSLLDLDGVEGATVFLYGEQGWGDHIHFCRYVKLVSDKGAKVVLEAPKPLFQLFKSVGYPIVPGIQPRGCLGNRLQVIGSALSIA
jgi:hypothetical protein